MRAFLLGLMGLVLLAAPVRAQDAPDVIATVAVTRDGARWTADYDLRLDRPAFAFVVSALMREGRRPWRPDRWTVQTPGVEISRVGNYDVLKSTNGRALPRRIRIAMRPMGGDLEAEYAPSLVFSDGAVALFSEQFDLIPLDNAQAALDLPADLNGVQLDGGLTQVTWRDRAGPVMLHGRRERAPTAADAETYVLFGSPGVREGPAIATVVDPNLPVWLRDELEAFTPRVMALYAERTGPRRGERPTVMVSWSGPTDSLSSMAGSVLPNLIVIDFEGEGVLDPSPQVLARARWFLGHEAAHFWLGSQGLRYEAARDAWITEGGADVMAVRALSTLDPAYDAGEELQREVDDCIDLSTHRGVASAGERGEHRAYYACGAVFWLVMEAAAGQDVFGVLSGFMADNADGVLSRSEWLDRLDAVSGDPSLRADIERLLDQGDPDPAVVIGRLFQGAGVPFDMVAGQPQLI
ncbi:MAG TPA: hypothetical protein PLQ03_13930 [Brevundimonas sp.]|uniref:hypothetical protein n=1 Tax=Brevundimonas sp. TaxID=1871086 RepID=UPI0026303594|nr:hypothetical protein [Brevundimonas sp.]HRO34498.1 hypothetical protein [Brevundimonas sp.]